MKRTSNILIIGTAAVIFLFSAVFSAYGVGGGGIGGGGGSTGGGCSADGGCTIPNDLIISTLYIDGGLTVIGKSELGIVDAGSTSVTTLGVSGATNLNTLTVTGLSILAGVDAGVINASGLNVNGNANISGTASAVTLDAGSIFGTSLNISGISSLGTVDGGMIIGTGLIVDGNANVSGTGSIAILDAGSIIGTSLTVSGVSNLGTVDAGWLQGTALDIVGHANISGTGSMAVLDAGSASITGNTWLNTLFVSGISNMSTIDAGMIVGTGLNIIGNSNVSGISSLNTIDAGTINVTGGLTSAGGLFYSNVADNTGSVYTFASNTGVDAGMYLTSFKNGTITESYINNQGGYELNRATDSANTYINGLNLVNSTTATTGVPLQYSPALNLGGTAYKTSGSSETWAYRFVVVPVSGAATSAVLQLQVSKNNGTYYTVQQFSDNAYSLTQPTLINFGNNLNLGNGVLVIAQQNGLGLTTTSYLFETGGFPIAIGSSVANSSSAIGVATGSANSFTTEGAKLHSFRNATVEKAYVDKSGIIGIGADAIKGGGARLISVGLQTTGLDAGTIHTTPALGNNEYISMVSFCQGAKELDMSDGRTDKIIGAFYRTDGGNVTQLGTTAAEVAPIGSVAGLIWGGTTYSVDTSTQKILVNVAGDTATTVDWKCLIEKISTTP